MEMEIGRSIDEPAPERGTAALLDQVEKKTTKQIVEVDSSGNLWI